VTWSPCRPVHYVVRPDNAPAGGEQVLQAASVLAEGLPVPLLDLLPE